MPRVSIISIIVAAGLVVTGAAWSLPAFAQQKVPISAPEPLHDCVFSSDGYIACIEGTWKATLVLTKEVKVGVAPAMQQLPVRAIYGCLQVTADGSAYIACKKWTWKVTRVAASESPTKPG